MRSSCWSISRRISLSKDGLSKAALSNSLGLLAVSSAIVLATGCGIGTPAAPSAVSLAALSGSVHGGQQAVTGATVSLYATTAAGYNGTPTLLGTTTTGSNGYFTFGTVGTCTAAQQAYVIASGGNPGLSGSVNNGALMMMASLGTCGGPTGISSSTSININEITTVAAAYALSGFMPNGGVGFANGAITAGITTSSTNTQGLADGFANANNLVSYSQGTPNATTASGGTVTAPTIVSLANALAACINTNGAVTTGTPCALLFAAATPPAGSGIAAPANTLQAVLDIARFPGNNVTGIYNVIPGTTAFGGGLSAAPNDWTLGITYTAANLVAPAGLTIDATDNVYTVGYPTAPAAAVALLEFSPQGALLSPAAGWNSAATGGTNFKTTDNVREMKIDPNGNVFMSDGAVAQIIEYVPAGTATAPTAGTINLLSYAAVDGTKNNWGLGIDTAGDVFSASYKANTCVTSPSSSTTYCGLVEFPAATLTAPVSTFGTSAALLPTTTSGSRDVALDSANHLAYTAQNQLSTVYINNYQTGTQGTAVLPTCALPYGIAVDGNSYAWVSGFGNPTGVTTNCTTATVAPSQLYQVNAAGTIVNTIGATTTVAAGGSTNGAPFNGAFYDAVDGNGNIFVANSGSSTFAEYSPSFNANAGALLSPNAGFAPGTTFAAGAVSGGTIYTPKSIAIDRSGATWLLSPATSATSTAGTLVQVFGAAVPTNPVLAAGGYGVKP